LIPSYLAHRAQQDPTILESGTVGVVDPPEAPAVLPENVEAFLKALKAYRAALIDL